MKAEQENGKVKVLASYFAVGAGFIFSFISPLEGYIVLSVITVWVLYSLKASQSVDNKQHFKILLLSVFLLALLQSLGHLFVYQSLEYKSSYLLSVFSEQDKAMGILAFLGTVFIFLGKILPLITLVRGINKYKSSL